MRKLKESKAITLVALVITIVVLIILAGVAISLSLGNNGLFTKAKQAKEEYTNATRYEEKEIGKIDRKIDSYVDGTENLDLEVEDFLEKLQTNTCTTQDWTDIINSAAFANACENQTFRTAMYNNASVVEPIIQNSTSALAILTDKSEIVEVVGTANVNWAWKTLYPDKAFVLSVSGNYGGDERSFNLW